jgi:PEGA domain
MKRSAVALVLLILVFQVPALAKPKQKEFNNSAKEVFDAALRTARERHVVTYVDEPHLMFTFETGTSMLSGGFVANASVEPKGESKCVLIINVQHKNSGKNGGFSFNAGGRMADKFFTQVEEELARQSTQKTAVSPPATPVAVPAGAGMSSQPQQPAQAQEELGILNIVSNPTGADVMVDGSFVGDAPATLKLKPGDHTISVQRAGYQVWTRQLKVFTGENVKLDATLLKQP